MANTREKKHIHTVIEYDLWFKAQTNGLKWADIFKVGFKVLTKKADTIADVEQRIKETEQKIEQNHREIEHWKEIIAKIKENNAEKRRIEEKNIIMRF